MSMADRDGKIWMDGKLVEWRDAKIHVLSHTLHYGCGAFEGVRAYNTVNGTAIFRLREHTERLFNSAKILRMKIPYTPEQVMAAQCDVVRANALDSRPEIAQLDRLVAASRAQADLARAARKPTLALGADAGTQGERYEFGRGRNFATVSLLLNWTLFDGGARRADVRAADASERRARAQRDELAQQVQLEVQQALDRLDTAADSLATAAARADAARAGFRIASRKRDEGVISQVEFIDARSALTGAELNLNLTRFALLAREAELDYATSTGTLPLDPVTEGSMP